MIYATKMVLITIPELITNLEVVQLLHPCVKVFIARNSLTRMMSDYIIARKLSSNKNINYDS